MTQLRRGIALIVGVAALIAMALAGSAVAQSGQMAGTPEGHQHGGMVATPGHGAPMAGSTGNGVVYLTVTNTGDEDDAIVGAATDRAEKVEVHEMIVENQVATMQPVVGPLPIPAGESVALEPGGTHLMMVNLTEDNRAGDIFELILTFEKAGEVTIQVPVRLDADPMAGEPGSETVEAGDLILEGAWSRPAPHLSAGTGATPEATPAS